MQAAFPNIESKRKIPRRRTEDLTVFLLSQVQTVHPFANAVSVRAETDPTVLNDRTAFAHRVIGNGKRHSFFKSQKKGFPRTEESLFRV